MKTLRINLHIRSDVSPKLFEALASMPPRPRAERLRKLAELGLQIEGGQLQGCGAGPATAKSASTALVTDGSRETFGSDLVGLLGDQ